MRYLTGRLEAQQQSFSGYLPVLDLMKNQPQRDGPSFPMSPYQQAVLPRSPTLLSHSPFPPRTTDPNGVGNLSRNTTIACSETVPNSRVEEVIVTPTPPPCSSFAPDNQTASSQFSTPHSFHLDTGLNAPTRKRKRGVFEAQEGFMPDIVTRGLLSAKDAFMYFQS